MPHEAKFTPAALMLALLALPLSTLLVALQLLQGALAGPDLPGPEALVLVGSDVLDLIFM